ncbi:hypothetical protein DDE18_03875 [Nocardioides gansuensis]|uniref:RNA polymerase sigma factor 70 region 4 type 2 domain-containing protein n=1 Tax=Nocardioides gansuensis TaxID=2138300 RepID=A0A2T8FGB0_9ACTN|nr:sigma-70 family RNA polymerase sigma factor [Nocardioides gansuensis]PVG84746.1 hypothetical protein DDE18_03875 [Nocardioides gansuensis]
MRSPDEFDAFYVSTRDQLLLETFALTGDLPASRTAVRDAFAVAWHHWRAVSRLEDPVGWLRPLAHGRAQRRHTARPWHRERTLDPELRSILDALARLSGPERRTLVLTALTPLPLAEIARVVNLPRAEAERCLQTATARFAIDRDVDSTQVRTMIDRLRVVVAGSRWPRSSIVRRAGTARRRTHTLVGVGVAVAALVGSGTIVAAGGAEPISLREERVAPGARMLPPPADPAAEATISPEELLAQDQVTRYARRLDWSERNTWDNLRGDGVVLPCQQTQFADPRGVGSLVRTFSGTEQVTRRKEVKRGRRTVVKRVRRDVVVGRAVELVELSSDERTAAAAFRTARSWYAGCAAPRTQLLETHEVRGVGDDAALFTLRSWTREPATISVAVARSGRLTVTTMAQVATGSVPTEQAAAALAAAVNGLCANPGSGTCAAPPRARNVPPLPVGPPRGMLVAADLPPVTRAVGPWVGTDAEPASTNVAATACDRTSFGGRGIRRNLTRTFLFPEVKDAGSFGLTQTVGRLSEKDARAFVDAVRRKVRACAEANLGTSVTGLEQVEGRDRELSVWRLDIEISDDRAVPFLMAIMRNGTAVSQVGLTPTARMSMSSADFRAVARRALERLADLPGR